MDFIRKPEVLATANAVGTASIYFILSKRLNSLTDEMDEIDNHLTSSIKKVSENSKSIQGMTETFKDVLLKFEDHRKTVNNISKIWKRLDDELSDMNERYEMLVNAVKDLGGDVDFRKIKKKKKQSKGYDSYDRRKRTSSSSDNSDGSSDSEVDKRDRERENRERENRERETRDRRNVERNGDRNNENERKNKNQSSSKKEYDSDEDFTKKVQDAKKTTN